jgi:hypothetical protein
MGCITHAWHSALYSFHGVLFVVVSTRCRCHSASVCSFPFLTCKNVSHMVRIIIIRLQRLPRQYLELSYMCSLFGSEIASTAVVSQLLLFCPSSPGSLGHIICTVRTHHAFMHELNLTVPSKTNVFF